MTLSVLSLSSSSEACSSDWPSLLQTSPAALQSPGTVHVPPIWSGGGGGGGGPVTLTVTPIHVLVVRPGVKGKDGVVSV